MRCVKRDLIEMTKPRQGIFHDLYRRGVEVETLPRFLILDIDDSGY